MSPSIKITCIEPIVLRLPQVGAAVDGTQDTCLVRIDTDQEITGWGEIDSCPTAAREIIRAPLSHGICNGLSNALLGADPLAIEFCTARMQAATNYYGGRGVAVHAMAGINMALWDIAGKVCKQPVYRLLGGPFRTRFRAYASVLFEQTPEATGQSARRWIDQGFSAVKFGWGPMGQDERGDIAHVREARLGLGETADLLIDAGQAWDARTAVRRANQFAEYRPFWYEEFLRPDDAAGYRQLSSASPVPIAAGESECLLGDFERLLDDGGLDWVQPDPARTGISTMLAVGHAAARRNRRLCNHTYKSGITMAASLHVLAALPNVELFELCMASSPLRHDVTRERFVIRDGFVEVPQAPGSA